MRNIDVIMRKLFVIALLCGCALTTTAVPAYRGWLAYPQADGSTVELRTVGDEFYHYTVNRAGQRVRLNEQGMYEVSGEVPTPAQFRALRAQAKARRQPQEVGVKPNLAPKGIVILANFKDSKFDPAHTQATFDELCNSEHCTVNSGYPSAAQYFADQSKGAYRPVFDVFGPVELTRETEYYGKDKPGGEKGDDMYPGDATVEACLLADKQFDINWADYDSDNDGVLDFVYVIYAGLGQAYGGEPNTIWPHNWEISSAREDGCCTYKEDECVVGGKTIETYAMSGELMAGNTLSGIGTLCHEFGHVIGLPDLYDTSYGYNYDNELTPGDWDIMDGGSYNGYGHCPPNYDPWEKYFFGWLVPENVGYESKDLELKANGTEGGKAYQLNTRCRQQGATEAGWCYYLENRQQSGWDEFLPGHGLLIWKINYDEETWKNNEPNNTDEKPLYTILSASGTTIGTDANPFPGTENVTLWNGLRKQSLKDIKEQSGVITMSYVSVVPTCEINWMVDGQLWEKQTYVSNGVDELYLPDKAVPACEGSTFIGWTTEAEWCNPFAAPADLFTEPAVKVTEAATYYAVFE